MSGRQFFITFRRLALTKPSPCAHCHRRNLTSSTRLHDARATEEESVQRFPHRLPETMGTEDFKAVPLGRPIGFPDPPKAGQNTGIDTRSLRERRDDFVTYEKHLVKRKALAGRLYRPYFMDFRNMKYNRGKAFLGNARLFKSAAALYFPNFHGTTLVSSTPTDTTSVLTNKISIVNVFSSTWASEQIQSFVGIKENPVVQQLLDAHPDIAQRVDVNIEENYLKAWLVYAFQPNIRKQTPTDRHAKYFMVNRGVSEEIRETIGLINSKVGYVYLVDEKCRIRWAACADASGVEQATLARGLQKLVDDFKNPPPSIYKVTKPKDVTRSDV